MRRDRHRVALEDAPVDAGKESVEIHILPRHVAMVSQPGMAHSAVRHIQGHHDAPLQAIAEHLDGIIASAKLADEMRLGPVENIDEQFGAIARPANF